MAKTPYTQLGSQDILSAHLNGIQYGINSIETVLGMATVIKTGQVLQAVIDMDDPTLRYRIYEAPVRNWLETPAPVIKRNGVAVALAEYEVQPAYGVVIFDTQQEVDAVVTADFTHLTAISERLDTMETAVGAVSGHEDRIDTVEGGVGALTSSVSAIDGRVTALEGAGPGGSGELTLEAVGVPLNPNAEWRANYKAGKDLYDGATFEPMIMGASTIDLFPFYVPYKMSFDTMRTVVASGNSVTATLRMGIYSNKGLKPDALLAQTASFTALAPGSYDYPLLTDGAGVALSGSRITLEPGLYWIGRYHSAGISLRGSGEYVNIISITDPADTTIINGTGAYPICAVRAIGAGSLLATIGPFAVGSVVYLRRTGYGISWVRKAPGY